MGSRPAAVYGGKIRHYVFYDHRARRHYEDVHQLEGHIVFCQSDLSPRFILVRFRAIPIDTNETIIQRIRKPAYGRADGNAQFSLNLWSHVKGTPESFLLSLTVERTAGGGSATLEIGGSTPHECRESKEKVLVRGDHFIPELGQNGVKMGCQNHAAPKIKELELLLFKGAEYGIYYLLRIIDPSHFGNADIFAFTSRTSL